MGRRNDVFLLASYIASLHVCVCVCTTKHILHHGSHDPKEGGRGFKIEESVAFHITANCVSQWDALGFIYFF